MTLVASSIPSLDFLCGQYIVDLGETLTIPEKKQMSIFRTFYLFGDIVIDGQLILE